MLEPVLTLMYLSFFLCCFCGMPLMVLIGLYLLLAGMFHWPPFSEKQFPAGEFFAPDQVILIGNENEIEDLISQLKNIKLEQLELPLRIYQLVSDENNDNQSADRSIISLFQIKGWRPNVDQTVRKLNQLARELGKNIQAEPNYLLGFPWQMEKLPWEALSSPWAVEGSTHKKGDSPLRKVQGDASYEWFKEQWALKNIELEARPKEINGENVQILILDTSPFNLPRGSQLQPQLIEWFTEKQPFIVRASHPFFAADLKQGVEKLPNMSNHGMFTAGLIHAVAPGSEISIIRVLADDYRGDLYTSLREIFRFVKNQIHTESKSNRTIIQFNPAIRVPPVDANYSPFVEIQSLKVLITALHQRQVILVAPAGNLSTNNLAKNPNMPAGMGKVISVAASNRRNQRACFSNQGELAAPGGDGLVQEARNCMPFEQDFPSADWEFGLIGPALEETPHSGFVFWSGTSFSAAFVSGLSALLLHLGGAEMTADQVREALFAGAFPSQDKNLGAGIINVRQTLLKHHESQAKKG